MSDQSPLPPDEQPEEPQEVLLDATLADGETDNRSAEAAGNAAAGNAAAGNVAAEGDAAEIQLGALTTTTVVAEAAPAGRFEPPRRRPPKPIELEAVVVSSRPQPFRFGIKAMFGLMVLCGLQFALVAKLGPLWGIFSGFAACLVAIGGLLVTAICYRPKGPSRALDYMDQLAIRLTLAVVVLFVAFIVAGGGALVWQQSVQLRRDSLLRNDLGFTAHEDYMYDGTDMHSTLVIDTISPGKPFDQAGLRKNDAILLDDDFNLYERLEENRGRDFTLNVAPVQSGMSTAIGPKRAVTVSVPAAAP